MEYELNYRTTTKVVQSKTTTNVNSHIILFILCFKYIERFLCNQIFGKDAQVVQCRTHPREQLTPTENSIITQTLYAFTIAI